MRDLVKSKPVCICMEILSSTEQTTRVERGQVANRKSFIHRIEQISYFSRSPYKWALNIRQPYFTHLDIMNQFGQRIVYLFEQRSPIIYLHCCISYSGYVLRTLKMYMKIHLNIIKIGKSLRICKKSTNARLPIIMRFVPKRHQIQ